MRSRRTALLLVLLLGAVGALLGGAGAAQARTAGAPTVASTPKTVNIMIMGYAFSPAAVTVNPGDTVIWTNMDTAKHDATSLTGPAKFGGPLIGKGETYTWVATASGPYTYYCSVHPDMKASLTVAPAAAVPSVPAATKAPAAAAPRTTATSKTPARPSATTRGAGTARAPSPAAAGARGGNTARAAGGAGSSSSAGGAAGQAPAAVAPASQAPVTQAVAPVSEPEQALDPTLLVVALAVGAAVFGLLVLGPRAPRTVRVVVPATPTQAPAPGSAAAPAEDVKADVKA